MRLCRSEAGRLIPNQTLVPQSTQAHERDGVDSLDEREAEQQWIKLSPYIDQLQERSAMPGEFAVAQGSALSQDDLESTPYQVSHAVRSCINAGIDHLHSLKVLVVDQGAIHVAGPYSLVRGALESFAAAYWMLGPDDRQERVLRTLRWQYQNERDQETALADLDIAGLRSHADRLGSIVVVGEGLALNRRAIEERVTSTGMLTYAEGETGLKVLLPWRIASGLAHGRPWATMGMSRREIEPTDDPEVMSVKLASGRSRILVFTVTSIKLLQTVLRLHEARASLGPLP